MIVDSHIHISCADKPKSFLEIKKELFLNMKKNKIAELAPIKENVSISIKKNGKK